MFPSAAITLQIFPWKLKTNLLAASWNWHEWEYLINLRFMFSTKLQVLHWVLGFVVNFAPDFGMEN